MSKNYRLLNLFIISLTAICTSVGLFWNTGDQPFLATSVNGSEVLMFGNGLYANESLFRAPILKGTDFIILFLVTPMMLITLFMIRKSKSEVMKLRLFYQGLLTFILYYILCTAFGAAYNLLFPVYILLFSTTLISFMSGFWQILSQTSVESSLSSRSKKVLVGFLIFAGLSVFVWMIEIVQSAVSGVPPEILGMSSTEPTYLLDIGIIAPACMFTAWLVYKNRSEGYQSAVVLLTFNALIGVMVISQTLTQFAYGVYISLAEFIPFVLVFVVTSVLAIALNIKVFKNLSVR